MVHVIGIVGGAPSGTAGLERLVAHLASAPLCEPVAIHVFNRATHFGAGDVYDLDQPKCLLTNVSVSDFDMWSSDGPPGVVTDALPLHAWCHHRCRPPVRVAETSHVSRALAGRYLAAGFEAIVARLPTGVTLHCHVGEVVDVVPTAGRWRVVCTARSPEGREFALDCDHLLLATGHTRERPTPEDERAAAFCRRHPRSAFIPGVYPATALLARVPAGATVAIKGLSLTFVDAVLALTEGAGGRFERDVGSGAAGRLRYRPSGREPARIVPFSRSGLPPRARASDIAWYTHQMKFATVEAHEAARRAAPYGKIDFVKELWPLYQLEMEWAYYRVLMAGTADGRRLDACSDDPEAMASLISSFHRAHPELPRFDAHRLLDPIGERAFASGADFQDFVLADLRRENEKARQGAANNAEKAAVEMWRFCRAALRPFAAFGGLTPQSHRRLHEDIWPRMQHWVFGPPIENVEKMLALAEVGLLDFSVGLGPEIVLSEDLGRFLLRCRRTNSEVAADILVDARVPCFSLMRDGSRLYQNLRARGLVRAFENTMPNADSYRPGAIDFRPEDGAVIAADGTANPDIAVLGIPTVGCIYDGSALTDEGSGSAGVWAANIAARLRSKELRSTARTQLEGTPLP